MPNPQTPEAARAVYPASLSWFYYDSVSGTQPAARKPHTATGGSPGRGHTFHVLENGLIAHSAVI